jgi:hypothetical protein
MPCLEFVQYTEYMDVKMHGMDNFKIIYAYLYNLFVIRVKIFKSDAGRLL